jgi:putative DNA primase/helicase
MLLTVANGTIDLRTGRLRQHEPADLITRASPVTYDADARCPRWERFLLEVFEGDLELIFFVRSLVGYCLTGDTREQKFAVLFGHGCNGKSTFLDVVKHLLGDLAATSPFESFARARGDRGPRDDIARLRGARVVTASEAGEGRQLDAAVVKEITGGDVIAARFLYGSYFEFRPEFKLLLATNFKPRVDGDDDAIWRRVLLIPFAASFEGREDRDLTATLRGELSGILNWALEGCADWRREGLVSPPAVQEATRGYRAEEDHFGGFLEERTRKGGQVTSAELWAAYEAYCGETGEPPLSPKAVGNRLRKRGFTATRSNSVRTYHGLRLEISR